MSDSYDPTQLYQRQIWSEAPVLDEWALARERRFTEWQRLRWRAYGAVKAAIKRGELYALPSPHVYCVDCGAKATAYDHRDYAKPLDVRAVCDKCNFKRGSARHAPDFGEHYQQIEGGDTAEDFTLDLTQVISSAYFKRTLRPYRLTYEQFMDAVNSV